MAVHYILNVVGENQDLQIYINSRNEIYIGESEDLNCESHQSIVLPVEDWPEIKAYIDNLIKGIE